ncbi:MAG: glucan ABC transporter ATP-binding protein/ permease [Acetobacteraceae bacterium]|nr:glucan ABC transporter ATP-binding protein/ permease [Acetobacteraceae bacterium]MSP29794.1 glucan ABC transporter ATP-binding protein/ permease [Acetobacteraceae bacterium]
MRFLRTYTRVLQLLGNDLRIAAMLGGANVVLAGLHFIDPLLFGRVIDLLTRSPDMPRAALWQEAISLLGLWAAVGIGGIAANIAVALQAERLAHRNRITAMARYYAHVLAMPLSFHGDTHSGRLVKMMISGTEALFGLWLTFFREHMATFVATLVLLPMTLFLNWKLAVALIVLVVLFCTLTVLVIRHTEAGQRQVESHNNNLAGTAQDALANVVLVQSFTRLGAEARLFGDIANQVIAHQFPVLNWWAVVNVLTRAASTVTVMAIVITGTVLHVNGEASVGEIVGFMGVATMLIGRLEAAVSFASRAVFLRPQLDDFLAVLDAETTVQEKKGATELTAPHGEVRFEKVSFSYPGGTPVLADVSFQARPGTTVALVGQTGAGKTTAMSLLQRLWDPSSGHISIDGQDLRDVTLDSLRRAVGVVFQDSMLFNRSIRDNLRMGRPDATDEELERACRMAEAHDFITRQPLGYDTMIGERGASLSGGQRQRLAIARALLKGPPILILDEATSALDAATEARVARALAVLMRGRTTFIIAHRLSTVRNADEILVFDAGKIVEQGTFDSLLAAGGHFAELVHTQLAGTAVKTAE